MGDGSVSRPLRILTRSGAQIHGHKTYMIGVPWQVAEALPDGIEFDAELTGEGLLFRPRGLAPTPAWAASSLTTNSRTEGGPNGS